MRKTWDEYFIAIAELVSDRATCDRKHCGAVIVKDNRIVATGYNGSPPGDDHCDDAGHQMRDGHCVRTIHAEVNAIAQAAKFGASVQGATMYINAYPCWNCFKQILSAGIKKVVYKDAYRNDELVEAAAQKAGVEILCAVQKSDPEKDFGISAKDDVPADAEYKRIYYEAQTHFSSLVGRIVFNINRVLRAAGGNATWYDRRHLIDTCLRVYLDDRSKWLASEGHSGMCAYTMRHIDVDGFTVLRLLVDTSDAGCLRLDTYCEYITATPESGPAVRFDLVEHDGHPYYMESMTVPCGG